MSPRQNRRRQSLRRSRKSLGPRSLISFVIHPLRAVLASLVLILCGWLLANALALRSAAAAPVDTFLVLGGSIQREIYAAELSQQYPSTKILISQGSQDPCIWLIFERAGAAKSGVWLENCADSTFGNFYFSAPILQAWGSRKVKLITSETHLPRAMWLGQILLGAKGIWVELDIAPEQGVPGNQESWPKTGFDVARSLLWAALGQVYQPPCQQVRPLAAVDIDAWRQEGFKCEYQGQLEDGS